MQTENVSKISRPPAAPDQEGLGPYLWTVAVGWLVLAAAGMVYARMKGIPARLAIPIIAAFLLELPLYLATFFQAARSAAARMPQWKFAGTLAITAVIPYLVYSIPTGYFDGLNFYRAAGLATALAFWYLILPKAFWSDVLFLAGPAAIVISKIFKQIYLSP